MDTALIKRAMSFIRPVNGFVCVSIISSVYSKVKLNITNLCADLCTFVVFRCLSNPIFH